MDAPSPAICTELGGSGATSSPVPAWYGATCYYGLGILVTRYEVKD